MSPQSRVFTDCEIFDIPPGRMISYGGCCLEYTFAYPLFKPYTYNNCFTIRDIGGDSSANFLPPQPT